ASDSGPRLGGANHQAYSLSTDSGYVGVHAGYQHQFGAIVIGVEAASSISRTNWLRRLGSATDLTSSVAFGKLGTLHRRWCMKGPPIGLAFMAASTRDGCGPIPIGPSALPFQGQPGLTVTRFFSRTSQSQHGLLHRIQARRAGYRAALRRPPSRDVFGCRRGLRGSKYQ